MRSAVRDRTPSLTSLPKDDEVICEVRPPRFYPSGVQPHSTEINFSHLTKSV